MMMLQKCIMSIQKLILINTWFFQIVKKKLRNRYDPVNLFLVNTYNYDMTDLKNKNRLMQQEKLIKKNLTCQREKVMKKIKEGRGLKILTRFLIRLPILLAQ